VWPPLSIIWVNYNSMGIMDIVLRSLKSILELEYPDYEVIVVDNASNDGSFEKIRDLVRGKVGSERPSVKLLRLRANKGYAGGVTEGFKARDGGSKYVVVMNNDVVVPPEALKSLVELAEQEDRMSAVNGVLLSYQNPAIIDSAGGILNELLTPGSLFSGWSFNEYRIRRPYAVAFADGPLALYNVRAVLEANDGLEELYDPWTIAYYDDTLVSLKLWNKGWRSIVYPRVIGLHGRSQTFKGLSYTVLYLVTRNRVAVNEITNSRFKADIRVLTVKRVLRYPRARLRRALRKGLKLGVLLRSSGLRLDLYRAPIALMSGREVAEAIFGSLSKVNARVQAVFEKEILKSYS
jgi:GT2 family glycosyltransferase